MRPSLSGLRALWLALLAACSPAGPRLETLDTGKPIALAGTVNIPRSAETFWYFSGWATKLDDADGRALSLGHVSASSSRGV